MAQAYPQVIVSQRTLFELEVHYINSLNRTWQNAIALQNYTLQGGLQTPPAVDYSSSAQATELSLIHI